MDVSDGGCFDGKVGGWWAVLLVRHIILVEEVESYFEKILCLGKNQLFAK